MTSAPSVIDDGRDSDVESSATHPAAVAWGLSGLDLAVVATAVALIVAFAPALMFEGWTPRVVLMLIAAPVGAAALVRLVMARDRASWLLVTTVVWLVFVSAISDAPRSALLGFAGRDLSAVSVAAALMMWPLGRTVSARGRVVLTVAVSWAIAMVGLIGLLQVVLDIRSGSLALAFGRPTGTLVNPVYFGALSACGLLVSVADWGHRRLALTIPPILLAGVATSLSGSRVALLAALVALGALAAVRRSRGMLIGVTVALGALVAGVAVDRLAGAGRNAADRLATASGGGRTTVWSYGFDSWLERPLVGHGVGQFRAAVQGRFSQAFVREHVGDEIAQAWFDPHNVVVGLLVMTGVGGMLLAGGWAAAASWSCRGALAWGFVPIVLHWLLQPVSIHTLPLAALMLGAAADQVERGWLTRVGRRAVGGALVAGVAIGGYVLAADLRLQRAVDGDDPAVVAAAADMYGDDPVVADVVAQVYDFFPGDSGAADEAIAWRQAATTAEPDRPLWWTRLSNRLVVAGRLDEAEVALGRAFELQHHNIHNWRSAARLAIARDDAASLDEAFGALCALGEEQECALDATALLRELTDDN